MGNTYNTETYTYVFVSNTFFNALALFLLQHQLNINVLLKGNPFRSLNLSVVIPNWIMGVKSKDWRYYKKENGLFV